MADLLDRLHRRHRAARHIVRVFERDQARPGAMRAVRTHHRANRAPGQHAVFGPHRPRQASGEPRHHRQFPIEYVRPRLADHLLPVPRIHFDTDRVAHRPSGHEQRRFLAGDPGRPALQPVHRRVFAVDVVADLGLHHRPPHCRGRPRHRIAAQIDYRIHPFINSANTSFDNNTPRRVNRNRSPSSSSRPSATNRSIGSRYRRRSSASGRIPFINLNPTKNRSS